MNPVIDIIVRSVIVYLAVVIAIRIFGKREISQLSVVDLVFILLISNSVQNAMVGPNVSLVGGLVAAGSLFVVNRVLGMVMYRSKTASTFLQGSPLLLIYHGHVYGKHLQQAEISLDELQAAVREHGVENTGAVDLAMLESDGNISVLSNGFQKHTMHRRRGHKVVSRNV